MKRDELPYLRCRVVQHRDTHVVSVLGEVDMATAPALAEAVRSALDQSRHLVVVDLTEVAFMGSAGLGVLLSAHESATRTQRYVRVVVGKSVVRRSTEIAGLDQVLALYNTVEDALSG
jgi:anti-anti-sigma factor